MRLWVSKRCNEKTHDLFVPDKPKKSFEFVNIERFFCCWIRHLAASASDVTKRLPGPD